MKTVVPFTKRTLALAVAAAVTGAMLAACGSDSTSSDDSGGASRTLSFTAIAAPTSDSDKRQVLTSPEATVNGTTHAIGFHTIMRSGAKPGSSTLAWGTLVDHAGAALTNPADGSNLVSNATDFSSLLPIGSKLFSISHFENVPGAYYLTELAQDGAGKLVAVGTQNIDMSAWGGVWDPCAGTVTPWTTHLGSEEYEPDARGFETAMGAAGTDLASAHMDATLLAMGRYLGLDTATATIDDVKASGLDPYKYGYAVEVAVDAFGTATVNKRLAMGRRALEAAYVAPDKKTVYLTDDGVNDGLYMFVADTAADLSAGKLYAAKWTQTSANGADGGAATISWVDMGHATQAEIQALIDAGTAFSDIFATETPNADGSCPTAGFKGVNAGEYSPSNECLKLNTGMEKAASRLESRRYAAYLGATTEFRKEEGLTIDPDGKKFYLAMSEISRGMEDNGKNGAASTTYDKGGNNDIRLAYNACGAVYQGSLGTDAAIGSDWVLKDLSALVVGVPDNNVGTAYEGSNTCNIDGIANPDNLTFVKGYKTLIIGEDTGSGHQNDAIWSYSLKSGTLTRIETTPYGSETTSPYWYPNIGGYGYLMSVVQHPYGESDQAMSTGPDDERAYLGYIGPFPAMD
jgi:secreted PhoX family phosphatase